MSHSRLLDLGHHARWLALCMLGLTLLVVGCAGAQPAASQAVGGLPATWVGKVDGTDAFIGIATDGKEVTAYVCDGTSISQWFKGQTGANTFDPNAGTLELTAGAAKLQAQLSRDGASGTVTLANGQASNFQAARATGDAGLYRSDDTLNNQQMVGGWVVLNDGQLRGSIVTVPTGQIQEQKSLTQLSVQIKPPAEMY